MKFVKGIINGVLAGILIIIGCSIYLACDNKYIGAVFFSVALLTICFRGYSLYTGKIGMIALKHDKEAVIELFLGLLGNIIGTLVFGLLISLALPNLHNTANTLVTNKLDQKVYETFIRAIFCGILMYIAVIIYKNNNKVIGILFCIPVFILSGFEHSIADMGYFAIGTLINFNSIFYIFIVILGNTVGGLLIPVLELITKYEKKEKM